jgi:hypothetical protein
LDLSLFAEIGDDVSKWNLGLWTDSDLASCIFTKRSTSGVLIAVSGPNSWAPIGASAQKATGATAESTPSAELVALAKGMRTEGIPLSVLFAKLLRRKVSLTAHEDNETAITAVKKGYSPLMRHLSRTYGISLARLNELFHATDQTTPYTDDRAASFSPRDPALGTPDFLYRSCYTALWLRDDPIDHMLFQASGYNLEYCNTESMRADGLTKAYDSTPKWQHAIYMMGMRYGPDDRPPPIPVKAKSVLPPEPDDY